MKANLYERWSPAPITSTGDKAVLQIVTMFYYEGKKRIDELQVRYPCQYPTQPPPQTLLEMTSADSPVKSRCSVETERK